MGARGPWGTKAKFASIALNCTRKEGWFDRQRSTSTRKFPAPNSAKRSRVIRRGTDGTFHHPDVQQCRDLAVYVDIPYPLALKT